VERFWIVVLTLVVFAVGWGLWANYMWVAGRERGVRWRLGSIVIVLLVAGATIWAGYFLIGSVAGWFIVAVGFVFLLWGIFTSLS